MKIPLTFSSEETSGSSTLSIHMGQYALRGGGTHVPLHEEILPCIDSILFAICARSC